MQSDLSNESNLPESRPASVVRSSLRSLTMVATALAGLSMPPALSDERPPQPVPEGQKANDPVANPAKTIAEETPIFVRVPHDLVTREFVKKTGFLCDHTHDPGRQFDFGYIQRGKLQALDGEIKAKIDVLDERSWRHNFHDRRSLKIVPEKHPTKKTPVEDYHSYDALKSELEKLAKDYSDIAVLKSAGKSVEGRELLYMVISDNPAKEEHEPNLLYIANMHGDEVVGRELMIYLTRNLLEDYKKKPEIKDLVDNAKIFIMPSMNPDGFEKQTRFNAKYVDLNRNFPDFTSDPHDSPDGRAPETQAIMALHGKHHFHLTLNFHGGAVCFNKPWDTTPNDGVKPKFPEDLLMGQLAREYSDANPSMKKVHFDSFDHGVTYGYEWYEVDGGMQDWTNYYRSSIHATVELSDIKWPDAASLQGFWEENKKSLVDYLQRGRRGIHLEVVNEQGEAVKNVIVGVGSSRREVVSASNLIHRLTPDGKHELTLRAEGYEPLTTTMEASDFKGSFNRIVLKKKQR